MKYMRHALMGVAVIGLCTSMVQSGPAAWAELVLIDWTVWQRI